MAIFYHVSTNLRHPGKFEPRIPSCRHKAQEDSETPRISVAPTIEDCLTAIPNGGGHLDEMNIQQRGYYLVFKIDTEKLGIEDEHIVASDTLYERDLVRDADISNEHWITKSFEVPEEDCFLIKLIVWEEVAHDIVPYSIYAIADEKYEGDYLRAYTEIYKEHVPCSVGITDPQYIQENVKVGEEISLYFESDEEKELVQTYLEKHYKFKLTTEFMDELTFTMKQAANLKSLFLYHERIINLQ